jgi:hypothetical protein
LTLGISPRPEHYIETTQKKGEQKMSEFKTSMTVDVPQYIAGYLKTLAGSRGLDPLRFAIKLEDNGSWTLYGNKAHSKKC